MPSILTRPATADDADALAEMCMKTFTETYALYNTEENMRTYMNANFTPQKITEELQNRKKNIFIAEINKEAAGYTAITFHKNEITLQYQNAIEIGRLYIYKKFQKNNIGKMLMNYIFSFAEINNADVLWLSVWQKNKNAIEFYLHMGFEIKGTAPFVVGNDVQDDFIMVKPLMQKN